MVSAGRVHTCAVRESGEIACWGDAPQGERLSSCIFYDYRGVHCDFSGSVDPFGLLDAPEGRFRSVSAGPYHTCAVRESGEIVCWGVVPADDWPVDYGQMDAPAGRFRSVSVNAYHSCAVRESGGIVCWGAAAPASGVPADLRAP